jgi:exosome complex protein LRP1
MDSEQILGHLDQLDDDIDDLEDALHDILSGPLSATSSKLPLLDQAKLYVLATYAIESVLFCE